MDVAGNAIEVEVFSKEPLTVSFPPGARTWIKVVVVSAPDRPMFVYHSSIRFGVVGVRAIRGGVRIETALGGGVCHDLCLQGERWTATTAYVAGSSGDTSNERTAPVVDQRPSTGSRRFRGQSPSSGGPEGD